MLTPSVVRPAHISPAVQKAIIEQTLCYAFGVPLDELEPMIPDVSIIDLYDPPVFEQGFPKIIRITAASIRGTNLLNKCYGWECDFTHCRVDEDVLRLFVTSSKISGLMTTRFLGCICDDARRLEEFDFDNRVKPFPDEVQGKVRRGPRVIYHLNPYWLSNDNEGKVIKLLTSQYHDRWTKYFLRVFQLYFKSAESATDSRWVVNIVKSPLADPWNSLHINRYDICGVGTVCMTAKGPRPVNPAARVLPSAQSSAKSQCPVSKEKTNIAEETLFAQTLSWAMNLEAKFIKEIGSSLSSCSVTRQQTVEGFSIEIEIGLEAMTNCIIPLLRKHKVLYIDFSRCLVSEDALIWLFNSVCDLFVNGVTLNRALTPKEELALQLEREVLLKRCPHLSFPLQFVNFLVNEKSKHLPFIQYYEAVKKQKGESFRTLRLVASIEAPEIVYSHEISST